MLVYDGRVCAVGPDGLAELAAALERHGLAAFLAAFPPHTTRRDRWARESANLRQPLGRLVDLFLLGEPVDLAELPAGVPEGLPALCRAGVAQLDGDKARLTRLSLFRPCGVWLLAEPPGPLEVDVYFGPDSIALAMHATYRPGASCLDLCAGPGFQGLVASGRCAMATLVEVSAEAAAAASLNAALNRVEERVEVRIGDLYQPVRGDRYDHVVANVPFLPVPPGRPFPVPGAGGGDGFAVARRVLADLPAHLADGGSGFLATMLLRGADGLLLTDELAAWARQSGCDVTVALTSEIPTTPDSPLVRSTAETIAAGTGEPVEHLVSEVTAHYATLGATAATWAFLRVDQGGDRLEVIDLGRPGRRTPWISML